VSTKQTAVGYVRVSRVGDREGDSFLSPELQREQIALAARREGLHSEDLAEWLADLRLRRALGAYAAATEDRVALVNKLRGRPRGGAGADDRLVRAGGPPLETAWLARAQGVGDEDGPLGRRRQG